MNTNFEFLDHGNEDEEETGEETGTFQEYQDAIDEWGDMQAVNKKPKPAPGAKNQVKQKPQKSPVEEEEAKSLTFDVTSLSWS